MTPTLESLANCFQGILASTISTCARDGTPNVTFLSQVHYVDSRHVALSCQFFNKTRRNVGENPHALIEVNDPVTLRAYRLRLRFVRSEYEGALFDSMALRIQAIASLTGMEGIFRLLSADIYEVLEITAEPDMFEGELPASPPKETPFMQVRGTQLLSQEISRSRDLDELLRVLLPGLEKLFGFKHSMLLVPSDSGDKLVTLASHGYGDRGVGAEVELGDGYIGAAAQQKKVLRVSGVGADLQYGRAVRSRAKSALPGVRLDPEIPLPGLPTAMSHLAVPLLLEDRLVAVLALEDDSAMFFDDYDEALLGILGAQIASALDRHTDSKDEEPVPPPVKASNVANPRDKCRTFTLFRGDDCVFVDGDYLIKNVPGLILWKLLTEYERQGRTEFSNRELRLDPSLKLPELRDNLESRLILLRKRLEQQCPDVRIVPVRRGRFALDVKCGVELVEKHQA